MSLEQPLTPEQILSMARTLFPDVSVSSCELFPGPHANMNYELALSNPTMVVVLKVYLDVSARRLPWKETHLLRMLTSETGVPVPRVLRFDASSTLIRYPWTLHTRLPGQPLSEVIDAMDDWEQESIGYETGRYLAHIHAIPLPQFGEFFVPDLCAQASEKAYVTSQVTQWLQTLSTNGRLSQETIDGLQKHIGRAAFLDQRQACLLHGDYTPENIMVDRGAAEYHVTGILEFEHSLGGSPERDISILFSRGAEDRPTFQKGFLDGYSDYGHLGDRFWQRLRFYQTYACLREMLAHADDVEVARDQRQIAGYLAQYGN